MRLVRVDDRAAGVVACLSGVAAAWSGAAPTGGRWIDALLVFLAATAVTWASASAPWWSITLAAGVGALLAFDPAVAVVGALAWLGGMWVGTQRRNVSTIRAVLGGLTANVLCRLEFEWFFGATALVGLGLGGLVLVTGLQRRHSAVRRWALRATIGLAAAAGLAGVGVVAAGSSARSDVESGRSLVAEGVDLLRDGDYADAAERFDGAAAAFESANSKIEQPWAQPARLVPVAAQNREAVVVLSARAASASAELANASLFIDPGDLRITNGRFDLEEIAEIEGPLTAAYDAMVELRTAIDDVSSPWLVAQIESPLESAAGEFDENIDRVDTTVQALQLAPGMLGGDGVRHYFIAFTTPAEARGLGGFMGNYAVLTADDGALSLTELGRTSDLNEAGGDDRRVDPPADWDALWGRFGLTNGPGGTTGEVPWSNVTMSPQFPSTASVIADLFPQSGGRQVDGVFALDPYVLQAMVGFTGPISIDAGEASPRRLNEQTTAQFLLFDQYAIEDAETRKDLLEDVAETVIDELLGGALPGPTVLADTLKPLADEGRLVGWMGDADEQGLLGRVGADGALSPIDGADGIHLVVNNAGANKLDAYLERAVDYRAEYQPDTGVVTGTVDVTFTNDGPTEGLPDGVIGNYVGDPIGTNRTLVTLYTALPVTSGRLDGEVVGFEPGVEAGWNTATLFVVLPPGESRTLSFTVAGRLPLPDEVGADDGGDGDDGAYRLVIGTQPLVVPADYDVEVTDAGGDLVVDFSGRSPGERWLTSRSPSGSAK